MEGAGRFADLLVLVAVLAPVLRRLPERRSLGGLGFIGAYLLFLIAPRVALLHLVLWCGLWGGQRILASRPTATARLLAAVLVPWLIPLAAWKLAPQVYEEAIPTAVNSALAFFSPLLAEVDVSRPAVMTLGLSVATFRGVDVLVQTWLGLLPAWSLGQTLAHGFFPFVLAAGPLVQPEETARRPATLASDLGAGGLRIACGFARLFLGAWPLFRVSLMVIDVATAPPKVLWLGLLATPWYLYLNFAGYTDLAIGGARILGYRLPENFDSPFTKSTPRTFWAAWNATLTRFAWRNVFVPLGGARHSRRPFALVATMLTIALWHGIGWPLVTFGLIHGLAVLVSPEAPPTRSWVRVVGAAANFVLVALTCPLLFGVPTVLYLRLIGLHV